MASGGSGGGGGGTGFNDPRNTQRRAAAAHVELDHFHCFRTLNWPDVNATGRWYTLAAAGKPRAPKTAAAAESSPQKTGVRDPHRWVKELHEARTFARIYIRT